MTDAQILEALTRVLRDLLMDERIVLEPQTRRSDVEGWDSFMYVNFIVAAEQQLGLRFTVSEVESFETAGDIVAAARGRLGGR